MSERKVTAEGRNHLKRVVPLRQGRGRRAGQKGAWSWTKGPGNWGGNTGPRLLIGKREGGTERPEKHKGDGTRASREGDGAGKRTGEGGRRNDTLAATGCMPWEQGGSRWAPKGPQPSLGPCRAQREADSKQKVLGWHLGSVSSLETLR